MGLTVPFPTNNDSQIAYKNARSPSLIYHKWDDALQGEIPIHPLLMKCFKSFVRSKGQIGGASGSIYQPFVGLSVVIFLSNNDSQIAQ